MRILEINKFNFIQGGADRHFLELIKLLKSQGNEVAVFSMNHPKNEFSPWKKYFLSYVGYSQNDKFLSKIKGALTRFYSFEAKRKIRNLLEDFQPEIVHIHNIYHQISPSILREIKKKKIPIVMTVHDNKLVYPHYLPTRENNSIVTYRFWDFVSNKKFKNSLIKSFLVALEFEINRALNLYDKYIDLYLSPSEFTKNKLIEGGIEAKKIIILPHFSSLQNPNERSFVDLPEKYVLHFGRLSKDKGVNRLIKIFQDLTDINLYLAGTIEGDLKIPNLPNIKHIGFQSPRDLERLIQNSLLVISASTLWETFGLVASEAILNGKPFIGFSGVAYSEIVEDNRSGFLVKNEEEMKEKIRLLTNDQGLRILFSRNALERAQKFTPKVYYPKIMNIFRQLTEA